MTRYGWNTFVVALLCAMAGLGWPVAAGLPRHSLPGAARSGAVAPPTHAQPAQRTAPAKVTPTRYNIDVAFEPEKHSLRASAAVTLRIDAPGDAIEFELNRHLTLRSVTDPQGRSLDFVRSGRLGSHKLLVNLAEPVTPGRGEPACPPGLVDESGQTRGSAPTDSSARAARDSESPSSCITLTFTYDGALPPAALDYITPDGILLRDESRWYPATDLSAFTTTEIRVGLPSRWQLTTVGRSIASLGAGLSVSYVWKAAAPVSSRALLAVPSGLTVTNTEVLAPVIDGLALTTTLSIQEEHTRNFNPLRQAILDAAVFFMRWFGTGGKTEQSGATERALSSLQAFPGQSGVIGYSAPGFLVVSEDVVKWHGHPGFAPEFLPHEIAHQWFPTEVTLRSEEDGWLAESLAEYLAWRYLQEKQPDDARRMVERAMRGVLAGSESSRALRPLRLGLKLFALEPWDITHATLYDRGMLVWRTLETVIDRERVDRALREYYRRYHGGSASIADFRGICEEISGRDLGWFFDYYINGIELPGITLRRLPSAAPNELAGEIHIANAPPDFQVRVEMRITTREGVVDHSVATRGPVTPFTVSLPAPATALELDPNSRILRVTETARRHRAQIETLRAAGVDESADTDEASLRRMLAAYEAAIALDPENIAANQQLYHLQIGRMHLRLKEYDAAWQALDRVLPLASLDPMATDLHRAWARVFRARIALARGDRAAARREAQTGLATKSPALATPLAWPGAPDQPSTASAALQALLK